MPLFDKILEYNWTWRLAEQGLPNKSHIGSQNNNKFVNE